MGRESPAFLHWLFLYEWEVSSALLEGRYVGLKRDNGNFWMIFPAPLPAQ